jgi:hypothetical protein
MSIKYQKYHRKNKRVLAQFKPGKVDRARTFNLGGTKYVYLIEVILDESPEQIIKFMPQDVEELNNNL